MYKVAIVDDHALFRAGLISLLRLFHSYDVVIEACNGYDFLEQMSSYTDDLDICILDINMPVMNGYETMSRIQQRYPKLKCMILSMHESDYSAIRMFSMGAKGYVLKGNDEEEFREALKTVAEGNYYKPDFMESRSIEMLVFQHKLAPTIAPHELTFLRLCCSDLSYKEIASEMQLSVRTVESYRDDLFGKLKLHNRASLMLYAIRSGIVSVF